MKLRYLLLAIGVGLALSACGGGSNPPPPTFDLMFEAPGGSGFSDGMVGGLKFAPTVTQDFSMPMGVAVTGQVTDGSGVALANVDVSFRVSLLAADIDADNTDGGGNYAVTVSDGTWVAVLKSNSPALGTMTVSGLAVAGPGPVTLDFQFPATVALSGTVFDSLGAGIDAGQVELTGAQTGAQVTVTANAAGVYTAQLVPDTYQAVVTPGSSAPTHLKQRFSGIAVSGPTARDFTLAQGVQVSGTVRMDVGIPLQDDTDIEVILPTGSAFYAPADITSNGDGTYSIGPVPTGTVTFRLEAPGDTGFPAQEFTPQIVGPTVQSEDFTLALGLVLRGAILRDDNLTPEENVEVKPIPTDGSLPPDDNDTDATGFFEISLFPGTYQVQITPELTNLQLPEVRTITVTGPTVLNVTLARGALLQGTVLQPDAVTPAADIRIEIPGVLAASDVTDGNGDYSFLAPPGTHTLVLVDENGPFEDIALDPVTGVGVVLPGPVTRDITITLATTGSTVVQGTVVAPDNTTPVPGVDVLALDAAGDVMGRAVTDAFGDYMLVIP